MYNFLSENAKFERNQNTGVSKSQQYYYGKDFHIYRLDYDELLTIWNNIIRYLYARFI